MCAQDTRGLRALRIQVGQAAGQPSWRVPIVGCVGCLSGTTYAIKIGADFARPQNTKPTLWFKFVATCPASIPFFVSLVLPESPDNTEVPFSLPRTCDASNNRGKPGRFEAPGPIFLSPPRARKLGVPLSHPAKTSLDPFTCWQFEPTMTAPIDSSARSWTAELLFRRSSLGFR
jgi:hypothetical protein